MTFSGNNYALPCAWTNMVSSILSLTDDHHDDDLQ